MPADEAGQGLERLLDTAEPLFMERGYSAVKLKHIAEQIGVKESSIYYHFPQGKEALFVAVMQRNFDRHREGIQRAIADGKDDWVAQLRNIGYWLISQSAIDVIRLQKADLTAIDPTAGQNLEDRIYESVNVPIRDVLQRAQDQGKANIADADLIAGMFIGMMSSIDIVRAEWNPRSKTEMVDVLVDTWVNGLRRV